MNRPRIELFRGALIRRWYFRFVAANGEIVVQSQGYRRKVDARDTIELVRQDFTGAPVVEL